MVPPKPKLFRAIAIIGMLIGVLGTTTAVGGVLSLTSTDRAPLPGLLGREPSTEAEAKLARRMQEKAERIAERHRSVSLALHLANGIASLLLLVGSVTLASRRPWAQAILLQALVASCLYEAPAGAHQARLIWETMRAQKGLYLELLRAMNQPATPDDLVVATTSVLAMTMALMAGLALMRVTFYCTGIWYLRRRDVRAWFTTGDGPRDP